MQAATVTPSSVGASRRVITSDDDFDERTQLAQRAPALMETSEDRANATYLLLRLAPLTPKLLLTV